MSTEAGRVPYSYRLDASVPYFLDDKPLVIFDGQCVLCTRGAQTLLKRDRRQLYRMAVAQSPLGQALYRHYGLNASEFDTYLLIEKGCAYFKSDATLRILRRLPLPYSLARVLYGVPRRLRDAVYDFIARRRLHWFGASQRCYVPSAQETERFLA